MRITVGHAVPCCVDEVATGFRGHAGRSVHPGVDDRHSYPGAGCELLRLRQLEIVAGPGPVREVGIGEDRGGSADAALFHRLVRARLIRGDRRRIDDRLLDRARRRSRQQHKEQSRDQRTDSAHAMSPPETPDMCLTVDSKLADHGGIAQKIRSRLRV